MVNSSWYEINAANPAVVQEAVKTFEDRPENMPFSSTPRDKKTKNEALYNVAKQLYAKYLEYFPNTANSAQVRFYLAEILSKQEKYVSASDQALNIVYQNPAAGNLRLDSIRYALSSLDRQLNLDRQKQGLALSRLRRRQRSRPRRTPSSRFSPTPKWKRSLSISPRVPRTYSTAKDAPDVLYEQAYLHYMHFELVPAYKSFWTLVQNIRAIRPRSAPPISSSIS